MICASCFRCFFIVSYGVTLSSIIRSKKFLFSLHFWKPIFSSLLGLFRNIFILHALKKIPRLSWLNVYKKLASRACDGSLRHIWRKQSAKERRDLECIWNLDRSVVSSAFRWRMVKWPLGRRTKIVIWLYLRIGFYYYPCLSKRLAARIVPQAWRYRVWT